MANDYVYNRVLLKLSGEALAGDLGYGIDPKVVDDCLLYTSIVGFDNSYPPYGFIGEDGANTGLDLDLAQAVCDLKGWNLQADAINWDNKDNLMAQGSINCIWNGFTMEGREDKYLSLIHI